ncbi:hypothetical protein [Brochothrix campestris]|uniref:Uncharacterized protein n=1 Tax=Brochothrix campestris FSL F6-1037 TaxID=1265861 RepID=W7CKH0_9LIST|nr:hypothetical protein [Brochothrix campestris]EUJ33543.1 hypothetical protein BCAMP_12934 [Brochothrix campestris FSL F6-1037]
MILQTQKIKRFIVNSKRIGNYFSKNKTDLSDFDYRYHRLFNGQKSSTGIIDYFMTLDVEFKETYELAQQLLIALQHKNSPAYQSLIQTKKPFVSSQHKR